MTNFVFIVADDMRRDLLEVMPLTRSFGQEMDYVFASNPTCGPSRISMLTGDLSRTTQNYGNNPPHGGWPEWHAAGGEDKTIATALAGAGYRTKLMGKYVNGYNPEDASFIPPGWTDWLAITDRGSLYKDVEFSADGVPYTMLPDQYLTDYLADEACDFIQESAGSPFFLWVSPVSPHADHVPAWRHRDAFSNRPPFRPESFNVASTGAKHFANLKPLDNTKINQVDKVRIDMMRCLLSLDELVARVYQSLSISGVIDDTMLVFTSDNGYMLGEHRMVGKAVPYVESTHMPLVVRYPAGIIAPPTDTLVQLIDFAPSMALAAGVSYESDGVPSLRSQFVTSTDREWVYIESGVNLNRPTFVQAQGKNHSFTKYSTGEQEYYNLLNDPLQLKSREGLRTNPKITSARAFVQEQLAVRKPPGWEDQA